jgi:methyl-accepting chemotaxis protein
LRFFRSSSIPVRLYTLTAVLGIGLIVSSGMALTTRWEALRSARITELEAVTETARGIIERERLLSADGHITVEEAKARALAEISAMRYGNGDYVGVITRQGLQLANPNPKVVGLNMTNLPDVKGNYYFNDVAPRAVRDGIATVGYWFPRAGEQVPVQKVSVFRYYQPWDWLVLSGAYMDDLDAVFWASASWQIGVGAVTFLILIGAATLIIRSIVRPIDSLKGSMALLATGETDVVVGHVALENEIGSMARSVLVFKDAAAEKRRLEATAAEERRVAEEHRQQAEARRAAAAQQQADVVEALADGLGRLSAGDLTNRLAEAFAPEYENLRRDFNAAMENLQAAMGVIVSNSAGIRSGTQEITQAADDLSRRTEQQAASLEETAAALDEITTTVRKTAEGANQTREVVSAAKAGAEHSGQVVRDAVTAMSEIESSARQIGQIIGVIDEIAFQTNLLALNAGVEAARAGESGRGFAVVASEVRALAQRSADAAKEIKSLILTSSQHVDRGVKLVGETGGALAQIVKQVTEINALVAEIAASAQEQATGLHQVNTAVNQMDQMTQQNAAMVEQSTAASHSLAKEAEELVALTERFQLGEEAVAAPPTRPARRAPAASVVQMRTTAAGARRGGAAAVRKAAPDREDWEEF